MTSKSNLKNTNWDVIKEVPQHWDQISFRQAAELILKRNRDGVIRNMLSLSSYTGLNPKNWEEGKERTQEDSLEYWIVERDQLVVNPMWVIFGSIAVSRFEGIVSPAYRVYSIRNNLLPQFLHYLMRSKPYIQEYNRHIRGLTTYDRSVRKVDFNRIPIFVPPKSEQNKIVNFLDSKLAEIDNYISSKQKQIDLLNEQKAAIINQAVTKGIDTQVKMKESSDKNIGSIPIHWQVKKLKFISEVIFSNVDKHSFEEELKVLLCNYVDVYKNDFIVTKMDFMEATATKLEIEKFSLIKDDIIITKDSESNEDIAKPSLVIEDLGNVICGYHLAIIRIRSKLIHPKYLYYLFNASAFNQQFVIKANGITRYGLSQWSIKDATILIPPIIEQLSIVSFIELKSKYIQVQISAIQRQIDLIKEYKQSLIAEAVTGKLKIS